MRGRERGREREGQGGREREKEEEVSPLPSSSPSDASLFDFSWRFPDPCRAYVFGRCRLEQRERIEVVILGARIKDEFMQTCNLNRGDLKQWLGLGKAHAHCTCTSNFYLSPSAHALPHSIFKYICICDHACQYIYECRPSLSLLICCCRRFGESYRRSLGRSFK